MAQLVKNVPAMWETWVRSLGLGRFPGEGNGYSLQYSGLENSVDCMVRGGHKESGTTERLSLHFALGPAFGTSLLSSYFHNSHEAGGVFVSILKTETGAQRGEMSRSSPHRLPASALTRS